MKFLQTAVNKFRIMFEKNDKPKRWRPNISTIDIPEDEDELEPMLLTPTWYKELLLCLKGSFLGRETASQMMRKDANATSGMEKWKINQKRRRVGSYTRYFYLAYGMLREVPYRKIEQKTHSGNEPEISRIQEALQEVMYDNLSIEDVEVLWNREKIKEWLGNEQSVVGCDEVRQEGVQARA